MLNITGVIKVRKMACDGQAEPIGEIRNIYKTFVTKHEAEKAQRGGEYY